VLARTTESEIAACWVLLDDEARVRAMLGFDPATGLPDRDEGKKEKLLEMLL
jgi:hypothetical protein